MWNYCDKLLVELPKLPPWGSLGMQEFELSFRGPKENGFFQAFKGL